MRPHRVYHIGHVFRRPVVVLVALALVVMSGCGSGGGGGGGGGGLQPFAISTAANPATAADVRNLLEVGDRYQYEPNNAAANALYDNIWAQLTAMLTWTESNPVFTYQFFNDSDPFTNWGRAYRYTGVGTFAGPIRPFTAGTYTRANGASYPAVILQTWDGTYAEILYLRSPTVMVHANQNTNGMPLIQNYTGATMLRNG